MVQALVKELDQDTMLVKIDLKDAYTALSQSTQMTTTSWEYHGTAGHCGSSASQAPAPQETPQEDPE